MFWLPASLSVFQFQNLKKAKPCPYLLFKVRTVAMHVKRLVEITAKLKKTVNSENLNKNFLSHTTYLSTLVSEKSEII
jgi:hypothetical protein